MLYQNAIIAASDDGHVYAIEQAGANAGTKRWITEVGKTPNEIFLFNNDVIVSTTDGNVTALGPTGNAVWRLDLNVSAYNVSYIYGAAANSQYIFVTANNGVYMIDSSGDVKSKLLSFSDSVAGAPAAGPDFVVFGKGDELYKISQTGVVLWDISLQDGSFWLSDPVIDPNGVYIGATDDKMHYFASSNGEELWNFQTRGWVASTPLLSSGILYFGCDDGKVYAIDTTGQLQWSAQTQLAVQTKPDIGTMGGREVVFVGGTDRSIYAIATDTGDILWKGPSDAPVGDPFFNKDSVVFGAQDGKVSAYSTERACSITSPQEADVVGLKEVVVNGNYVSAAGGATVDVSVNGGDWQPANTSDVDWVYYINPSTTLSPALNTISCKVSDAGGDEQGPAFTSVVINYDPTIPLSDLTVLVNPNIIEKAPFTLYIYDADDGSPVDRFTLTYQGQNISADKNYTMTIDTAGTYKMTISKMGFNDAPISVDVNASGVSPIILVIGAVVIIAILWFMVGLIRKRGAKKR